MAGKISNQTQVCELIDNLVKGSEMTKKSGLKSLPCNSLPREDPASRSRVSDVINALRKSTDLPKFGYLYDELLQRLFRGEDLKETVLSVAKKVDAGLPDQIVQGCYSVLS